MEPEATRPADHRFAWILTALFLAWGGLGVARHECWRDEVQAFLVARDVPLGRLFAHLHWEGHPSLWYLALKLVAWTRAPETMQALHVAIAAVGVWLFAAYAPLPRLVRALWPFGRVIGYEYTVISRNYALGVVGLVAACVLWPSRRRRPIRLAVVLALTAHTNICALIVAAALVLALTVEWIADRVRGRSAPLRPLALVVLSFVVAGALAAWQMRPPPQSGWAIPWRTDWSPDQAGWTLLAIGRAYFGIPREVLDSWHTNLFDESPWALELAGAMLVLVTLWSLARQLPAMVAYAAATVALAAFVYGVYFGALRHHGHFLIALALATWIARSDDPKRARAAPILLGVLLAIHLIGGLRAWRLDWQLPFSSGRAAAAWLKQNQLAERPMVGDADAHTSPVLAYLGKEKFFYTRGARWGSYVVWDELRLGNVTDQMSLQLALVLARTARGAAILVLNHPLGAPAPAGVSVTELARFTGGMDPLEDIWLYRVAKGF